jgi:hypothetical protein
MTYALLQTAITPPPVDALQRAFKAGATRTISAADAIFAADDAFGILSRDLPEEDALSLAAALAAEEIIVDVVAERDLPRLPEPQFFLSAHLSETTIEFFDAREKADPAPWAALRLIAVGYDQRDVRLELIFGDATFRYFTTLDRFLAHHSPEATGRFATERFIHFVQKLAEHAPEAVLNRGASLLLSASAGDRIEDLVAYPRPSAFVEEITWLLWQARKAETSDE